MSLTSVYCSIFHVSSLLLSEFRSWRLISIDARDTVALVHYSSMRTFTLCSLILILQWASIRQDWEEIRPYQGTYKILTGSYKSTTLQDVTEKSLIGNSQKHFDQSENRNQYPTLSTLMTRRPLGQSIIPTVKVMNRQVQCTY